MKTILLVANKVPHYRVSVYNFLCRRFSDADWKFIVASDSMLRETDMELQFEFHELPFRFNEYRRLVSKLGAEVVILHLHLKLLMFWPFIHWLKWRRIPVISWTKGANLDQPDSRLRYEMFNYSHRLSDALLMYSPNEVMHVKRKHRRKIFAANNAINSDDFPIVEETNAEIKAEFDIPFEKVVLFVGTMGMGGERKRVKHLIDTFAGLGRSDVGLVLVGSGMSDADKSRIDPANTVALGAVHDPKNIKISKLFKAADIYVVPGHVGLGINQAFHWGLPVVTEACKQPPEIHYLKSGRNGFIVPDNDIAALREKMLYLLDNDLVRAEFSRNAREDIRRDASIEGMFQGFLKAVEFVHPRRNPTNLREREATTVV